MSVAVEEVMAGEFRVTIKHEIYWCMVRGELSYLAPLGSENISAPYFKQCF